MSARHRNDRGIDIADHQLLADEVGYQQRCSVKQDNRALYEASAFHSHRKSS